jgi:hypothetical protein
VSLKDPNDLKPFDYDVQEKHLIVTELAPVVPPEYLRRVIPYIPVVIEATDLIHDWYLFLSQMMYDETVDRMNPGQLDKYLARMHHWLCEMKGRQQVLHPTPVVRDPSVPFTDQEAARRTAYIVASECKRMTTDQKRRLVDQLLGDIAKSVEPSEETKKLVDQLCADDTKH